MVAGGRFELPVTVFQTVVLPCIRYQSACAGVDSGSLFIKQTRHLAVQKLMVEDPGVEPSKSEAPNAALCHVAVKCRVAPVLFPVPFLCPPQLN